MISFLTFASVRRLLPLVVCTCTLQAYDDKLDLTRTAPVPADQPIPAMDFFRPVQMYGPRLNPAGTHIAAFVSGGRDNYDLLVYDMVKKEVNRVGGYVDRDVYAFTWLTDRRLAFSLSREKLFAEGLFVAEIGRGVEAYPIVQGCVITLLSVPDKDPAKPLVWVRSDLERRGEDGGIRQVNTSARAGDYRRLGPNTDYREVLVAMENNRKTAVRSFPPPSGGIVTRYLPDRQGELAFSVTQQDGHFTLHHFNGRTWGKSPADLDEITIWGYGEEPGEVIAVADHEPGKPQALRFMNAVTGTLGDIILADPAYDFEGQVFRHPRTRAILGVSIERAMSQMVWFGDEMKALQKLLEGYFPGRQVRIIDIEREFRQCLVSVYSDRHPAVYYRVDFEKRSLEPVNSSRPWIDPERMQPMNVMKFKTRDGYTLEAYLTLPAGTSKAKPAPLVVMPHGGPWVRDTWGFDGTVQFLVSRGYAVMQPNYRGSPGYDWMFPTADLWDFRKMHEDVTDATKTLLRSGLVDANRVAIVGGSFGGYLAMCGAAYEPELYQCAVTLAGVFDWAAMIKDAKFDRFTSSRYAVLRRRLGDPKAEREKFDGISPLRALDNVKIPVFVAHGKEDSVVGVSESRRLVAELRRRNLPHDVWLVSGEGHGMGHLKNEVQLYTRIEAFLAKHLPPKG
jgi:acetyl esterase/lipase